MYWLSAFHTMFSIPQGVVYNWRMSLKVLRDSTFVHPLRYCMEYLKIFKPFLKVPEKTREDLIQQL